MLQTIQRNRMNMTLINNLAESTSLFMKNNIFIKSSNIFKKAQLFPFEMLLIQKVDFFRIIERPYYYFLFDIFLIISLFFSLIYLIPLFFHGGSNILSQST